MRTWTYLLLPLSLSLASSCRSSSPSGGATATQTDPTVKVPAGAATGGAGTAGSAGAAGSVPVGQLAEVLKLNEAAVRAIVTQWLAAQNAGVFADYEKLYAERFNGVKRVGAVARTYNRAGWLDDRRRMFGALMQVTATDIVITVDAGSAVVRLTQTFAQKAFKDSGSKELLIVDSRQGLKIAREEMLQSKPAAAVGDAMPMLRVAGADYVVLSTEVPAPQGPFEALGSGTGYDFSARRKISTSTQDPTGRQGQTVTVYPGGKACQLGDVYMLGFGTPHFSTLQGWRTGDTDGDGVADQKPMPLDQQNENAIHAEMLAGQVASCPGEVALMTPGVEWQRGNDKELEALAAAAFIKNAGVQKAQREFAEGGDASMWYGAKDGADVQRAVFESNGRRIVIVGAAKNEGGCGEFSASVYLVFEVVGTNLVPRGETGAMPSVAVAVDAKSLPILVIESKLTVPSNGTYADIREIDFGYQDCPC